MITKIEDITPLEITLQTENYHQVLSEYFGEAYWTSEFEVEEIDIEENKKIFAVYNNELDEICQLGIITLTYENKKIKSIHLLREIL
ncbi:TPA: hypothetical protein NBN21_003036 [Enterococcus faecium]|nr:hypothetical protein [Enterococcus faecium]HCD4464386.1 hypothetical protein [Enterococcus faecalis]HAP8541940.1 hypothetical protein [Enterococcus faecium]HAP8542625.1 hypothetical protein [Enterococcus faecium]HAP9189297.1 hypothetical protein [Enterococcus faecium]